MERDESLTPFSLLKLADFQSLVRDLLARQPIVDTCEIYAKPGRHLHGICLVSSLQSSNGLLTAYCSAKTVLTVNQIRKIIDTFIKNRKTALAKKDIRHFYIVSANNLGANEFREVLLQKERLAKYNVELSSWSAETLMVKLQPHPEILRKHGLDSWIQQICGGALPTNLFESLPQSNNFSTDLTADVRQLSAIVQNDAGQTIEQALRNWREGSSNDADRLLEACQSDAVKWNILSSETKATILTLRGRIALEAQDLDAAQKMLSVASSYGDFKCIHGLNARIHFRVGEGAELDAILSKCDPEEVPLLKASFALSTGNTVICSEIIKSELESNPKIAPDLLRLQAISQLLSHQVADALISIERAVALEPAWRSLKVVAAIVHFYSAVVPSEIPKSLPPWPAPIDWTMVKENGESKVHLNQAAIIFKELLLSETYRTEERQALETWLLATLSINRSSQSEAQQLCDQLLFKHGLHEGAVFWALARNFKIDLQLTESELLAAIDSEEPQLNKLLCFVLVKFYQLDYSGAFEFLEGKKLSFKTSEERELWRFWVAQALLLQNQTDAALALFDEKEQISPSLLSMFPTESIELEKLGTLALKSGRDLFDLCVFLSRLEKWEEIAAEALRLVNEVETPEALFLAAHSLIQTEQFTVCDELLRVKVPVCCANAVPEFIALLQAECCYKLGRVNESLATAAHASFQSPTTKNLFGYAQLLARNGDALTLRSVAKKLCTKRDLTEANALRLAQWLHQDDPELAKRFWVKAAKGKLQKELRAAALMLGFQLGMHLSSELQELVKEVSQQEPSTEIQNLTLEQALELIRADYTASEARRKAYQNADAPAAILCDVASLVEYSASEHIFTSNHIGKTTLLAVHEDRAYSHKHQVKAAPLTIIADVSALMVAHKFEFLESVINKLGPITISGETIQTLLFLRERRSLLQEQYRSATTALVQLVDIKRVFTYRLPIQAQTFESIQESVEARSNAKKEYAAQQSGHRLVRQRPDSHESPEVVDCNEVLNKLFELGEITSYDLSSKLTSLGLSTERNSIAHISKELFAEADALEALIHCGVIDKLLKHFTVYVEHSELNLIRVMIDEDQVQHSTVNSLTSLIEQLFDWIQSKRIDVLPHVKHRKDEPYVLYTLASLLQLKHSKGNQIIWVDDRFVNKHAHQSNLIPIWSSWDVLMKLSNTDIGESFLNQILQRLRRSNVKYLPLTKFELTRALDGAHIFESQIVETSELKILRVYVAGCLKDPLMKSSDHPGPVRFLSSLKVCIIDTWDHIWCGADSFEDKKAKSNWLVSKLFADPASITLLGYGAISHTALANTIFELLFTGLEIAQNLGLAQSTEFLNWLNDCMLRPLLREESRLAETIAECIKRWLYEVMKVEDVYQSAVPLIQWWYQMIPRKISASLAEDRESMNKLGLSYVSLGTIFGYTFRLDDFEELGQKIARTGNFEKIQSLEGSDFSAKLVSLPNGLVAVTLISSEKSFSVFDDQIQLLFNKAHYRREALMRNFAWFDVSPKELERVASAIAYLEPASLRLSTTQEWKSNNLARFYAKLVASLRKNARLTFTDLLPDSAESILRHHRLKVTTDPIDYELHAVELYENEPAAFLRWIACIPANMRNKRFSFLTDLEEPGKETLIRSLLNSHLPVATFQLLSLLTLFESQPKYRRLKVRILKFLFSAAAGQKYQAFVRVLRWVNNQFSTWSQTRVLPDSLRLAITWTHASQIFAILTSSTADTDWISKEFARTYHLQSASTLDADSSVSKDCTFAENVYSERLLLAGLSSALTDQDILLSENSFRTLCLLEHHGQYLPNITFLQRRVETNLLNTFLITDIDRMASLIPTFGLMTQKELTKLALLCVQKITSNEDAHFYWLLLYLLGPNAVIDEEIGNAVQSLLEQTALNQLVDQAETSYLPITVATIYGGSSANYKQEIISEMMLIASKYAEREEDTSTFKNIRNSLGANFLDSIIRLCSSGGKFDFMQFRELTLAIAFRYPPFLRLAYRFVEALWIDLPPEHKTNLWDMRTQLKSQYIE